MDFIVVMDTHGIRYSHPQPERIGQRFVGTIEPSLAGHTYTESVDGPLGKEIQAVVPVTAPDGKVVGLVSAGLTVKNVTGVVDRQLPVILLAIAAGVALATMRHGTDQQTAAPPDPRAGHAGDDPHVRAPRRGAPRRPRRGADHRR